MTIIETTTSRAATNAWEGSTGKYVYVVQLLDTETETEAVDYIWENAPSTFTSQTGTSYKKSAINVTPNAAGCGILDVEVVYTQAKPLQFSATTSGGTEKIEFSRGTVHWFDDVGGEDNKDAADVPNFEGGINVTKNSIEGVTIKTAQMSFKITYSWALADIDGDYLDKVEALTACVNSETVTLNIQGIERTYRPGELLFEGADYSFSADRRIEMTFSFSVSRGIYPEVPATHRYVGTILVTDKRGWDYLWVRSEETTSQDVLARRPTQVYIEQVYFYADLNELEISELED